MATTRSQRKTSFSTKFTPEVVGPGAYAPPDLLAKTVQPSYSAFSSSDKRNLNKNTGTSAMTPGPGAYVKDAGHGSGTAMNAFATKVSRFAPHAPGSSIYMASTVQDNPGPGTYTAEIEQLPAHAAPVPSRPLQYNTPGMQRGVPTIPRKDQSYGYTADENGVLKRHTAPASTYSGLGQDTVGPAGYNVRKEPTADMATTVPSLKSTVKREVWEELSPRIDVPGPGTYAPKLRPQAPQSDRPNAVFASKVPILPEPRRIEKDEEKALLLALQEQSHNPKPKVQGVKKEQFGSTAGRTDIASNINTPFIQPTYNQTPGPGTYVDKKTYDQRRRLHSKKSFRDDAVGFQAISERPCLAKTKPAYATGPGTYSPAGHDLTLEKAVRIKQHVGRNGVFGSTTERFLWNLTPEVLEAEEQLPGPGKYTADSNVVEPLPPGVRRPRVYTSSAFRSTTSRFPKGHNHAPQFHIVGECAAPAVGDYDLVNVPPHRVATNPFLKVPFLSQGPRSEIGAETMYREVPGPGQYEVASPRDQVVGAPSFRTRANTIRSTLPLQQRFERKPTKPHQLIGPGAYTVPGTVGVKTFNVTMRARNQQHA
ncbi:hypothetical protein SDRG_02750 [Saprolegnia diclina VS20]|uniref:Sperm-tail PG-rich repeat-containing protein 2 n=1 Tax=Saprolegnia diclina (strain VS20) TaxID=1156394 RepID=T0QZG4_SAPDV|nr:hypothetical protein SDRG_02750 [Saprolegnia diclina VS20]EQC40096.1 hypothetical protein SDRG_02750 [Saprolegnia diclina VS20]|eukprot:XP_008606570.1 hypothetical protein SDRG_02750 [Saprolegnia diclina VS20]